jgi:hypothetical protein
MGNVGSGFSSQRLIDLNGVAPRCAWIHWPRLSFSQGRIPYRPAGMFGVLCAAGLIKRVPARASNRLQPLPIAPDCLAFVYARLDACPEGNPP